MTLQLTHSSTPFNKKKFPIKVICDGVNGPANIGSLFRICEAFGVEELLFLNTEINFKSSRLQRTSRGTISKVSHRIVTDIPQELKQLQANAYKLIALEIAENSIPIEDFHLSENQKIALIIGSEQTGISEAFLRISSQVIHINLFGENSSVNVVQATSIALYALTKL
jgi:tRNA G18 (ribose-2'-O)-methylase SpoU